MVGIHVHHYLRSGEVTRGLHDSTVAEYATGLCLSGRLDEGVFFPVLRSRDMTWFVRVDNWLQQGEVFAGEDAELMVPLSVSVTSKRHMDLHPYISVKHHAPSQKMREVRDAGANYSGLSQDSVSGTFRIVDVLHHAKVPARQRVHALVNANRSLDLTTVMTSVGLCARGAARSIP